MEKAVTQQSVCHNYNMEFAERVYYKLKRWQSIYRREKRLLFPSPAEMKLIELMGGKVLRIKFLKDINTGFPMAFVIRNSKLFRLEKIKREVGYGPYWVDFANDINRIIEVDGSHWHMDVVSDMEREIYIKGLCERSKFDARILRIRADELWRDPNRVQMKVLQFLAS